ATGSSGTGKVSASIQSTDNFQTFKSTGDVTLGTGWTLVTMTGTVTRALGVRGLQVALNFGYDPQTIQVGGLVITSSSGDPNLFQTDSLAELRYTGTGTFGTVTPAAFTSAPGFFQSNTVAVTTKPTNPFQFQAVAKTTQAVNPGDTLTVQ